MKKWMALLLGLVLTFGLAACGEGGGEQSSDTPEDAYTELLFDADFSQGFNLYGADSRYHASNTWAQLLLSDTDPFWKLGTWGNFVNYFLDRELTVVEDGVSYTYPARPLEPVTENGVTTISNPTYTVKVDPESGWLSLKLDSSQEYGVTPSYTDHPRLSAPRKDGEAWPHLIIEENLADPTALVDMEEVVFTLDFQISEVENLTGEDFNPDLHTAQITWFVSIACINPFSAFYNQYIWFGLPIYDFRSESLTTTETAHFDGGKEDSTGMLIYSVPQTAYLEELPAVGERIRFSVDMMDYMERAFERAQDLDLFTDCTLADMRLINTNLGWELPGTFDATFEIFDMSIKYKPAEG